MTKKDQYFETNNELRNAIDEHVDLFDRIKNDKVLQVQCLKVAKKLVCVYKNKGKLLLCGNGGSAAQAQHLAAELIGRFYLNRKALSAEALSANTSTLSALANDYSFKKIFSRQIEAKGESGDMLILLTTSGQSKNIFEAIKASQKLNIFTVVLTGQNDSLRLLSDVDSIISVPSKIVPRIQEAHIFIGHFICEYVERELFSIKQN